MLCFWTRLSSGGLVAPCNRSPEISPSSYKYGLQGPYDYHVSGGIELKILQDMTTQQKIHKIKLVLGPSTLFGHLLWQSQEKANFYVQYQMIKVILLFKHFFFVFHGWQEITNSNCSLQLIFLSTPFICSTLHITIFTPTQWQHLIFDNVQLHNLSDNGSWNNHRS